MRSNNFQKIDSYSVDKNLDKKQNKNINGNYKRYKDFEIKMNYICICLKHLLINPSYTIDNEQLYKSIYDICADDYDNFLILIFNSLEEVFQNYINILNEENEKVLTSVIFFEIHSFYVDRSSKFLYSFKQIDYLIRTKYQNFSFRTFFDVIYLNKVVMNYMNKNEIFRIIEIINNTRKTSEVSKEFILFFIFLNKMNNIVKDKNNLIYFHDIFNNAEKLISNKSNLSTSKESNKINFMDKLKNNEPLKFTEIIDFKEDFDEMNIINYKNFLDELSYKNESLFSLNETLNFHIIDSANDFYSKIQFNNSIYSSQEKNVDGNIKNFANSTTIPLQCNNSNYLTNSRNSKISNLNENNNLLFYSKDFNNLHKDKKTIYSILKRIISQIEINNLIFNNSHLLNKINEICFEKLINEKMEFYMNFFFSNLVTIEFKIKETLDLKKRTYGSYLSDLNFYDILLSLNDQKKINEFFNSSNNEEICKNNSINSRKNVINSYLVLSFCDYNVVSNFYILFCKSEETKEKFYSTFKKNLGIYFDGIKNDFVELINLNYSNKLSELFNNVTNPHSHCIKDNISNVLLSLSSTDTVKIIKNILIKILNIKNLLSVFITNFFKKDVKLEQIVKSQFEKITNSVDSNIFIMYLNFFIHEEIEISKQMQSFKEIINLISFINFAFKNVYDKDVFTSLYCDLLSDRLFKGSLTVQEIETYLYMNFQKISGNLFKNAILMQQDIYKSSNINKEYYSSKEYSALKISEDTKKNIENELEIFQENNNINEKNNKRKKYNHKNNSEECKENNDDFQNFHQSINVNTNTNTNANLNPIKILKKGTSPTSSKIFNSRISFKIINKDNWNLSSTNIYNNMDNQLLKYNSNIYFENLSLNNYYNLLNKLDVKLKMSEYIEKMNENFSTFYKNSNAGKELRFLNQLSNGEITMHFTNNSIKKNLNSMINLKRISYNFVLSGMQLSLISFLLSSKSVIINSSNKYNGKTLEKLFDNIFLVEELKASKHDRKNSVNVNEIKNKDNNNDNTNVLSKFKNIIDFIRKNQIKSDNRSNFSNYEKQNIDHSNLDNKVDSLEFDREKNDSYLLLDLLFIEIYPLLANRLVICEENLSDNQFYYYINSSFHSKNHKINFDEMRAFYYYNNLLTLSNKNELNMNIKIDHIFKHTSMFVFLDRMKIIKSELSNSNQKTSVNNNYNDSISNSNIINNHCKNSDILKFNTFKNIGESENIQEDRKLKLDAILMSIVKKNKIIEFSELIKEVCQKIKDYFNPDIEIIKLRIDSLLDRSLISRDENNINLIKLC